MTEHGDAHNSDDCLADCEHPDHLYLGDDDFWDLRVLMDLREMAQRNEWQLGDVLKTLAMFDVARLDDGPVVL